MFRFQYFVISFLHVTVNIETHSHFHFQLSRVILNTTRWASLKDRSLSSDSNSSNFDRRDTISKMGDPHDDDGRGKTRFSDADAAMPVKGQMKSTSSRSANCTLIQLVITCCCSGMISRKLDTLEGWFSKNSWRSNGIFLYSFSRFERFLSIAHTILCWPQMLPKLVYWDFSQFWLFLFTVLFTNKTQ